MVIHSNSLCLAVQQTTDGTACICIWKILSKSPFSKPVFDPLTCSPGMKHIWASVWLFGMKLGLLFPWTICCPDRAEGEKGADITSHGPSLLSADTTPGMWQLEEGGAAGFLPKLRVKELSFVSQASLYCSSSLLLGIIGRHSRRCIRDMGL